MPARLKWLLAVHLVLGMAPVFMYAYRGDPWSFSVDRALANISWGQLVLLALWAAMARGKTSWRWFGSLAGLVYLALWPSVAWMMLIEQSSVASLIGNLQYAGERFLPLFGALLVIRRWFAELVYAPDVEPTIERYQFSLWYLLIATTAMAVILGLSRASAGSSNNPYWFAIIKTPLLVVYGATSLAAAWATLAPGAPWRRLAAVLLFSTIPSFALAYSEVLLLDRHGVRIAAHTFACLTPYAIVVLSLLVVRSAGYRLVSKRELAG